jgi:hypothetical protein
MSEFRANIAVVTDEDTSALVKVRAKRLNLVDDRDDIHQSRTYSNNCWKEQRKAQARVLCPSFRIFQNV